MEFTSTTPTNFLILFFPEKSATKLKIPAHISVLQKSVTLRDKYKKIWQVKTRKVDGHWYLLDGWAKFVADSSVTIMDILVFNYSGPGSLDVNILGPNGDIKEGVGGRKIDNPKNHQNMESDESEDVDTFERVSSRKNKKLVFYNSVEAKGKRGKEVLKYQDDTDEYEIDDDCSNDIGQGYWDGEGDNEREESDGSELVYRQKDKCKEVAKELRKSKNDNNASGSRKPQQKKKRNVDCLSKGILKSELTSKPKRSYSVKRMKPLYSNGSNKEKWIWNNVSEDDEEGYSEEESIELTRRNVQKGKGRMEKDLRAGSRTYTVAGNGFPFRKRRNMNDCRGNKIVTSRSTLRPKIPSSGPTILPRQMNELYNRGKGILNESSDKDSDSDYWPVTPMMRYPKKISDPDQWSRKLKET